MPPTVQRRALANAGGTLPSSGSLSRSILYQQTNRRRLRDTSPVSGTASLGSCVRRGLLFAVSRPCPPRDLAQRMKLRVALGLRVQLRDPRTELNVAAHGFTECFIVGKPGLIERLHVQGDEPLPLLLGDLEVAVHAYEVIKSQFAREAVPVPRRIPR